MLTDIAPLRAYFEKLGLEPQIADLYLALHAYGPQTISELARHSGIERTRVYRLLGTLTNANLVEAEVHYKRTILRAAPIMNLQILLTQREQEVRNLQTELTSLHHRLNQQSLESPLTRVQFYRGLEGTKQMFWNETRSSTEVLCILYEVMQRKTNQAFFERWAQTCNERGVRHRGVVGDHFLQGLQDWYQEHSNERLQHWESRYLPSSVYAIGHSIITYDNVVAHYNWKDGEVFGIEIYNQKVAEDQRQVFELLWRQGAPVGDDLAWRSSRAGSGG